MDYIYAIVENGTCVDVVYLSGPVSLSNYIQIDAETAKTALYATYAGGVFTPAPPQELVDIVQEIIADSATLTGGNVVLDIPAQVQTGTLVKFDAPCTCAAVTGGLVIGGVTYQVCDAMGQCVTGQGGVWNSGAMVAVLIDQEERKAFIQNGKVTPEQIGAGTFGGKVVASSSGQTHSAYLLRNTKLSSTDETPSVDGQICWTYR